MKTVQVDLDWQSAEILLASWEKELSDLRIKADELQAKIANLRRSFGMLDVPKNDFIFHYSAGGKTWSKKLIARRAADMLAEMQNNLDDTRAPRGLNRKLIRDYLRDNSPASTSEIAKSLSLSPSSVSTVLMTNSCFSKCEEDGMWSYVVSEDEFREDETPVDKENGH